MIIDITARENFGRLEAGPTVEKASRRREKTFRKIKPFLILTYGLFLFLFAGLRFPIQAMAVTMVRLTPAALCINQDNQELVVRAMIEDVTNLAGFEFTLNYPVGILQIDTTRNIKVGDIFAGAGNKVLIFGPSIDPETGKISLGVILSPGVSPVSGSGSMASFSFTYLPASLPTDQAEPPGLTLEHVELSDSAGNQISSEFIGLSLLFYEPDFKLAINTLNNEALAEIAPGRNWVNLHPLCTPYGTYNFIADYLKKDKLLTISELKDKNKKVLAYSFFDQACGNNSSLSEESIYLLELKNKE